MNEARDHFPTWHRLQQFRRLLTPITRARTTAALLGLVSLAAGLGIIVIDGFLSSYPQFRHWWIAIGALAFYGPGLCFALAYWGLKAGRVWTLWVAIAAAGWQGLLAGITTACFAFFTSPFSLVVVVGGLLWVAIDTIFALQLLRARPWVKAQVEGHRGFAVEAVQADPV